MRILQIDSSARDDGSASRRVGDALVAGLIARHPGAEIVTRDLARDPLPYVNAETVEAYATPEDQRTPEQRAALRLSETLITELESADVLVLTTPIYNFGIPAPLKTWIDLIVRARRTFRYGSNGPEGLLSLPVAWVVAASGGTEVGGELDFATPYLRHILGFIGIEAIESVAVDGLVRGGEERIQRALADVAARVGAAG